MRKIIILLLVLMTFGANAQRIQKINNYGYAYNRFGVDTLFYLPSDTFSVPAFYQSYPFMAKKGSNLYLWNTSTFIWELLSGGGGSYTFPYSVVAPGNAIQLENDTTANPANYFYGRNSAGRRGWYPQSGITGVNIYNSDGTFTGYRTVNGNYNGFEMSNISSLNIGIDDNAGMTGGINIGGDNADNDYHIRTIGSVGESGIYGYRSENKLYSVTAGSDSSFVQTDGENGISIKAFDGSLKIPLLNATTDTTGKSLVIRNLTTGLLENIDPALIANSGDITRGTTVINNGTDGYVLYDSSGIVGAKQFAEVDITGIVTGDFLKWDGTKFVKKTPDWITDLRYSNDSVYKTINGTESLDFVLPSGGGLDSIDVVTYDSLSTSNVWINSTLKRMGYRVDSFYYHIAITDSVRYINPDPPPGYDADAQAYFDAITGAGGSLTTPQMDAMNAFVLELKAASIWSGTFDFIHFLVGGSEAATKFNLIDPQDLDASYRLTFTNSATFASTGVTTNGTTQYINTHDILRNATYADSANYHIGVFNRTSSGVAGFTFGVNDGASSTLYGLCRSTDDKSYFKQPNTSENNFTDATTGKGFYLTQTRAAATQATTQKDGVSKIAVPNNGNGLKLPATYNLLFNAYNSVGSVTQYRAGELVLISSGRGFSDAERSAYETAVANFITALGL